MGDASGREPRLQARRRRAAEGGGKAASSAASLRPAVAANPFYNAPGDSQSGTLVRGSPDKIKKVVVKANRSQESAEEELAEVTREINERFVKVHHVEGRSLAPGEQPEHYTIEIPLRFIR